MVSTTSIQCNTHRERAWSSDTQYDTIYEEMLPICYNRTLQPPISSSVSLEPILCLIATSLVRAPSHAQPWPSEHFNISATTALGLPPARHPIPTTNAAGVDAVVNAVNV